LEWLFFDCGECALTMSFEFGPLCLDVGHDEIEAYSRFGTKLDRSWRAWRRELPPWDPSILT